MDFCQFFWYFLLPNREKWSILNKNCQKFQNSRVFIQKITILSQLSNFWFFHPNFLGFCWFFCEFSQKIFKFPPKFSNFYQIFPFQKATTAAKPAAAANKKNAKATLKVTKGNDSMYDDYGDDQDDYDDYWLIFVIFVSPLPASQNFSWSFLRQKAHNISVLNYGELSFFNFFFWNFFFCSLGFRFGSFFVLVFPPSLFLNCTPCSVSGRMKSSMC